MQNAPQRFDGFFSFRLYSLRLRNAFSKRKISMLSREIWKLEKALNYGGFLKYLTNPNTTNVRTFIEKLP